jgi:hypothetical protein
MVQSERAIVTTTAEIFFECKEKDRVLVTWSWSPAGTQQLVFLKHIFIWRNIMAYQHLQMRIVPISTLWSAKTRASRGLSEWNIKLWLGMNFPSWQNQEPIAIGHCT